MTKISNDEVKRLAALAKLQLTEAELSEMASQLTTILAMIDQINTHDTSGVKPTSQVTGLKHVTREDSDRSYGTKPVDLLESAAETKDGAIKVSSVK